VDIPRLSWGWGTSIGAAVVVVVAVVAAVISSEGDIVGELN